MTDFIRKQLTLLMAAFGLAVSATSTIALQDDKAKVFKTPQDAYDAFENAEKKKPGRNTPSA